MSAAAGGQQAATGSGPRTTVGPMQRTPGAAGRARAAAAFARRARERVARGEPLTVAVGGTELVLPPDLRHAVLNLLEQTAEGTDAAGDDARATAAGGDGGDGERVPSEALAGGLPPLPLRLPPRLTAGQAADLLGVSRSALTQMIDRGELAATTEGTRRLVATADVLAVRQAVRAQRSASVADVVAASAELGLYPQGAAAAAGVGVGDPPAPPAPPQLRPRAVPPPSPLGGA
jgi:excisionase family DNA binding protein